MRCTLFIALLFASFTGYSQNDMMVLKKRGKIAHTYFAGQNIYYQTRDGMYNGYINAIKNDTLFLSQFDIRQVMNYTGGTSVDTVATYRYRIAYRDIIAIVKPPKNFFSWQGIGTSLFYGGMVLTTAGLVTWVLAKPNTRYYARPELVIGAAALTGIGYLLMHTKTRTLKIGKKYRLDYVELH